MKLNACSIFTNKLPRKHRERTTTDYAEKQLGTGPGLQTDCFKSFAKKNIEGKRKEGSGKEKKENGKYFPSNALLLPLSPACELSIEIKCFKEHLRKGRCFHLPEDNNIISLRWMGRLHRYLPCPFRKCILPTLGSLCGKQLMNSLKHSKRALRRIYKITIIQNM